MENSISQLFLDKLDELNKPVLIPKDLVDLGIFSTPASVTRALKDGRLEHFRPSANRVLISKESVAKFVTEHTCSEVSGER